MSIATEIARLQQAKADIAEAIVAKGGEVSGKLDNYASAIEALPSGGGGNVACLEGDITLTSVNHYFDVTHNMGKKALFAEVELVGGTTATWTAFYAYVTKYVGSCVVTNGSLNPTGTSVGVTASTLTSVWYCAITENAVRFNTISTTSYKFPVGTWHYKIYFEI